MKLVRRDELLGGCDDFSRICVVYAPSNPWSPGCQKRDLPYSPVEIVRIERDP